MIIVKATLKDVDEVLQLVVDTRAYLKEAGIPQWQGSYPSRETLTQDVDLERLYVAKQDDEIIGMFALVYPDHNYDYIEDGKWEDNTPYIAIHRMAVKASYKGKNVAGKMFDFVKEDYDHIRVDTHKVNNAMNRSLVKNDFNYRGVIYVEDGTPRNAYEWSRKFPKIIGNFSNEQSNYKSATI